MDFLPLIQRPIQEEFSNFIELFNRSMSHSDGLLGSALSHISQRGGKRMRPLLTLLAAKNFGQVNAVTLNAAVGLELLHTASLVHDDVVDESVERRGQPSVNAMYNNKVAVLVGDYVLSTALLHVSLTDNQRIVQILSELGRILAAGEILQLSNIKNQAISEDVYYQIIKNKTAALFEACAKIGAISVEADEKEIEAAAAFGLNLGIMFQIRDDIFDYYDSKEIGKPTGNDMAEGKLTLPIIYALNSSKNDSMLELARKVKAGTIVTDEIAVLVDFAKRSGGIEYAEQSMEKYRRLCQEYIRGHVADNAISEALNAYVDYVIYRKK